MIQSVVLLFKFYISGFLSLCRATRRSSATILFSCYLCQQRYSFCPTRTCVTFFVPWPKIDSIKATGMTVKRKIDVKLETWISNLGILLFDLMMYWFPSILIKPWWKLNGSVLVVGESFVVEASASRSWRSSQATQSEPPFLHTYFFGFFYTVTKVIGLRCSFCVQLSTLGDSFIRRRKKLAGRGRYRLKTSILLDTHKKPPENSAFFNGPIYTILSIIKPHNQTY